MDAELILLPKNCDVRSHFRVSTRDAILYVDRLKWRWDRDRDPRPMTDARKQGIERQHGRSGPRTCQPLSYGLILRTMAFYPFSRAECTRCCCMRAHPGNDAGNRGDWPKS